MLLWLFVILPVLVDAKALATSDSKDRGCSFETETYSLSWAYDDPSSDVVFKMVARSKLKNFWAGFFMGDDQPEDSIGAFVQNGQIGLMDGYAAGSYILLDNTTNVQALLFDLQDDTLTAEFARPISSNDPTDADLSGCITFFFPSAVLELGSDGQIIIPQEMHRRRICDLLVTCGDRERTSGLVKRSDASVCEHTQGKSTVRWNRVGNEVAFSIGQNVQAGKWWSAIGLGQGMQDLKMAVAFMEDGVLKSLGGFQTQGYGVPRPDPKIIPKLNEESTKVSNDRSFVQFSLPLEMFDANMDESGCVTLQIAILGGEWNGDYTIKKHEKTPEAVLVCGIDQCRDETNGNSTAPSTIEPQVIPEVTLRPESSGEEETAGKDSEESQNTALNKEESEGSTVNEEIKEDVNLRAPTVARLPNEVDSSGVEPANETSVFASAARAVDALPEGSGSEASAEGEDVSKIEESKDDEVLTTVPNSVVEEELIPTVDGQVAPKLTTVDGDTARNASLSPELIESQTISSSGTPENGQPDNFPTTTPLPSSLAASPRNIAPEEEQLSSTASTIPTGEEQTTPIPLNDTEIVGKPLVLSKTVSPALSSILTNGCGDGHTDIRVCDSYFADYLGKVREWAEKNSQIFEQQMWKACKLLSQVKHVPTMCCDKFRSTCVAHLQASR